VIIGALISAGLITVYAKLPGRLEAFVILLHLRPDDTVQRAESNLLRSLNDDLSAIEMNRCSLSVLGQRELGSLIHLDGRSIVQSNHCLCSSGGANALAKSRQGSGDTRLIAVDSESEASPAEMLDVVAGASLLEQGF
jgi:hypothetical protein